MRKQYDLELDELNTLLIKMAATVEQAVSDAMTALKNRDKDLAISVSDNDRDVDRMERQIEDMCLMLLLKQQPVAGDLRFISAALKIITDLERIGDHAQDICEISLTMDDKPLSVTTDLITRMFEESTAMIKMAVDAFITKDEDLATQCINHDDVVDDLFVQVREKLIHKLQNGQDDPEESVDLLQIAKYLERVGDHAQNIGEWVVFSLTGHHKDYLGVETFGV
ncbi:phosphate signaling complex protein PhoU [Aedoeadaptatus acetigenes]|uniref:Phosphate-specific transport system accessory protein PhoU n=1 Tax=Aedoeadaptatus acetigenes TaxID=2981723 RepID=A0ABV1J3U8_9FIRM|nr:phosphate signaling complex protein PhoU [Aedoeadaptatus acetigenes]MBS6524499.1 phosphate signaling complex protein PhoU [Peptoniphilaceae bacterium]MCU6785756.1 phosphate signaling complex protein PhoU [Aedoeadaptatus acetigenes]